jgi:hypothetical protein
LTSFDVSDGEAGPINATIALSVTPTNGASRARFLQSLNEDECSAPDIEPTFLSFILGSSRAQCEGTGTFVSDAEFDAALAGFSTIFDSE